VGDWPVATVVERRLDKLVVVRCWARVLTVEDACVASRARN
jgi:hypothetical protein